MALFAEDSTVVGHWYVGDEPAEGLERIRYMQDKDIDSGRYEISNVQVNGNRMTWGHDYSR